MAIFYDYIKGTEGDWTETKEDNSSILHQGGTTITKIKFNASERPTIIVGTTDYGSIITTGGDSQTIKSGILKLKNLEVVGTTTKPGQLSITGDATLTGNLAVSGTTILNTIAVDDGIEITMGAENSKEYNNLKCNSLIANQIIVGEEEGKKTIIKTDGITTGNLNVSKIVFPLPQEV